MNNPYHSISPAYPQKVLRDFRVKVILLIAAFVFSCFTAIRALVDTWSAQDVYSYGYLVPVFSLLWVWHEKESVRRLPIKPALTGGMLGLLTGGLMLVLGEVSGTPILQELAMVVIIPSLVMMLLGTRYLVALSLPLSYLVLMVPLLDGFIDRLQWPFQIFAAATAVKLLNVINIPVFRTDQFLELPNITLEVANACSGVRFLISTMVLCIPLAFITQKSWAKRVLLVLFAILMSVCANPLRVALVAAWAYYGNGDIHGPLHIFQGYVVYVIGMAILFLAAWVLREMPFLNKKHIQKTARARTEDLSDFNKLNQALLVSLVMLLGLGAYAHFLKSEPVPLKMSLNELPVTIGEWKNSSTGNNMRLFSIPGADAELARVYRNASGREVKLQIAYFGSQRQNKKLTYYKLQMLYDNNEELTVLKDADHVVPVNKTLLRSGSQDTLFLSWFNLDGQIVANRYAAKLKTAFNGIVRKRTNGAFFIVSSATSPNGLKTAMDDEISFVQNLLPVLDKFIP